MDNSNETKDALKGIATLGEVNAGGEQTSDGHSDSSKADTAAAETSATRMQPVREKHEPQGDPVEGTPTWADMQSMMAQMKEFEAVARKISADRDSLRESLAKTQAALADLASQNMNLRETAAGHNAGLAGGQQGQPTVDVDEKTDDGAPSESSFDPDVNDGGESSENGDGDRENGENGDGDRDEGDGDERSGAPDEERRRTIAPASKREPPSHTAGSEITVNTTPKLPPKKKLKSFQLREMHDWNRELTIYRAIEQRHLDTGFNFSPTRTWEFLDPKLAQRLAVHFGKDVISQVDDEKLEALLEERMSHKCELHEYDQELLDFAKGFEMDMNLATSSDIMMQAKADFVRRAKACMIPVPAYNIVMAFVNCIRPEAARKTFKSLRLIDGQWRHLHKTKLGDGMEERIELWDTMAGLSTPEIKKYHWAALAARNATANAAVKELLRWFSFSGLPELIGTDGGSHFLNKCLRGCAKKLNVSTVATQPLMPWTNGRVERLNRDILKTLRVLLSEYKLKDSEWPALIPLVQYVLNTTPRERLGNRSPAEVHFGRKPRSALKGALVRVLPGKGEEPTLEIDFKTLVDTHMQTLFERFEEFTADIAQYDAMRLRSNRGSKTARMPCFNVGDFVLVAVRDVGGKKLSRARSRGKMVVKWAGPMVIVDTLSRWLFKTAPMTMAPQNLDAGQPDAELVHVNRMRRYADRHLNVTQSLVDVANNDAAADYLKCITDWGHKATKPNRWRKLMLRCEWFGYVADAGDESWEPIEQLFEDARVMVKQYLRKHADVPVLKHAYDQLIKKKSTARGSFNDGNESDFEDEDAEIDPLALALKR